MLNIEELQYSLSRITIDNEEIVSKNYFNENYGYPGLPVIFKRAFQNFDIKAKWNPEYLIQHLPAKEVVEDSGNRGAVECMTLKAYLQEETGNCYFKTSAHLHSDIQADYITPKIFDCWYANTSVATPRSKLSWMYVGKKGTFSELHRDLWWSSAWNYLISGIKIWLVYPQIFNEFISRDLESYQLKDVIADADSLKKQKYKPLICIQEPGDLVFVPGNYYHAVYNNADTISLTENFINETNYDMVRSYFRTRKNKNNRHSIEAIIKEGFQRKDF